jgi:hypothetical protein
MTTAPPDLLQNSRSSSVDDLQQWGVSSAAELARRQNRIHPRHGPWPHGAGRSAFNTLPGQMSGASSQAAAGAASAGYRSSSSSSSAHGGGCHQRTPNKAVKIDLSNADRSIRRPDSAPDLASEESSPKKRPLGGNPASRGSSSLSVRRGGLKHHHSLDRHASLDRGGRGGRGGLARSQTGSAKRVMFTGVSDIEDEEDTDASDSQQVADDEDEDHVKPSVVNNRKASSGKRQGGAVAAAAAAKPPKRMNPHQPQQRKGMVIRQTDASSSAATDIWVLRSDDKAEAEAKARQRKLEEDAKIPVTGVVVARPQPCASYYAMAPQVTGSARVSQQQQQQQPQQQQQSRPFLPPQQLNPAGAVSHPRLPRPLMPTLASSAPTTRPPVLPPGASGAAGAPGAMGTRPPPPPPPPRTTPVAAAAAAAAAVPLGPRPVNPALQRPALSGQVHESPDEGYHEDDGTGSEML